MPAGGRRTAFPAGGGLLQSVLNHWIYEAVRPGGSLASNDSTRSKNLYSQIISRACAVLPPSGCAASPKIHKGFLWEIVSPWPRQPCASTIVSLRIQSSKKGNRADGFLKKSGIKNPGGARFGCGPCGKKGVVGMSEKSEKSEKSHRAYEKVVDYIRGEIWQGTLKRGERLPPERELAETLGVSRNSVREAIRTLSMMGFVSSTQGAGNFVTCDFESNVGESLRMMLALGETNYMQISQLRRALETEAARLSAERILPKQAARMQELVRLMREDVEQAPRYDMELHRILVEASGNHLIKSLFSAMMLIIEDFIQTMNRRIAQDPVQFERLNAEHGRLAQALAAHDHAAAAQALMAHFEIVDYSIREEMLR